MQTMINGDDSIDDVGIVPSEAVGAALFRIGLHQFDRGALGLEGQPDRDTGIHEARKALKRLRALLRLVRPHLDAQARRAEDVALRDVGRVLAPLRDARVTIDTLDAIAPTACPPLRATLEQRHAAAFRSVSAASTAVLAAALSEARTRWEALFPGSLPGGFEAVAPGIARTYKRGRKRMRRVAVSNRDRDFHEWRKEVKHLRYQMEALRPMDPAALHSRIALLDELGELLGAEHDLTVLMGLVESEPACGDGRADLLRLLSERRDGIRHTALGLGGEGFGSEPPVVVESLRRTWEAAREDAG